ncbi:hypothetical protein CPter91_4389 [Collimonas pratensis]|uniref:Uncharacterized protein n=1 Tax=Collimonas pratensis TaxID=279113 RepID=A0A127Q9I1_9BURK|nr:hypothetical protein CPter91_4389 [Collimonas pratensis]
MASAFYFPKYRFQGMQNRISFFPAIFAIRVSCPAAYLN